MKKLLITGASGFLGWNLCQQAQADWQVYGTYFSHAVEITGTTTLKVDLCDLAALRDLFQTVRPDAVIHTAAMSTPNACQLAPEAAYAINVTASWHLADLCADAGIPCVFTSTDMVFDGLHPPYGEQDPVSPINIYAEQKVAAEQGMGDRYPATAICRMPLMFGVAATAQSFIQPFIQALRDGKELSLFMDEFRCPASGASAAQGLLLAVEKVQGILHLGGRERISRYEFGQLMVEILGLPPRLKPCLQADVPMAAPRPPDLTMDSSLAYSLGYAPKTLREELMSLKPYL